MFGIDDAIIASVGANLVGNFIGSSNASRRQEDAQAFNAEQFATRYQITTKDMIAAGLNPMLAYSQGGGAGASSSAAGADSGPDLAGSINQAKLSSAQAGLLKAQTENQAAQGELYSAQAAKARMDAWFTQGPQAAATYASADQSRANIAFMETQSKKILEELKNIPLEGDRLIALTKQLAASSDLMNKQGLSEVQRAKQLEWLALSTMYNADLQKLDIDAAKKFDNFAREFKQYEPIVRLIESIFGRRSGGITINK